VATTDYAVKINRKEGALEVTGPDKDWVDAKVEQLAKVLSDYGSETPGSEGRGRSPAARKRTRKDGRAEATQNGADSAPRRGRGKGGRSEIDEDLRGKLTTDVKKQLEGYIAARRKKWGASQSAQAAIIATFLHDELGLAGVDEHDLYTVYTVMGERSPGNIRSQLTNARQRAHYFSGLSGGKMVLSHAGENFARFDSLDGADDDGDDS
jgi:hypothetical protein